MLRHTFVDGPAGVLCSRGVGEASDSSSGNFKENVILLDK